MKRDRQTQTKELLLAIDSGKHKPTNIMLKTKTNYATTKHILKQLVKKALVQSVVKNELKYKHKLSDKPSARSKRIVYHLTPKGMIVVRHVKWVRFLLGESDEQPVRENFNWNIFTGSGSQDSTLLDDWYYPLYGANTSNNLDEPEE